jgi:hypothetical protein
LAASLAAPLSAGMLATAPPPARRRGTRYLVLLGYCCIGFAAVASALIAWAVHHRAAVGPDGGLPALLGLAQDSFDVESPTDRPGLDGVIARLLEDRPTGGALWRP